MFGRFSFIILLFFLFDYLTTILHIYTKKSNSKIHGSSMRHKEGKARCFKLREDWFYGKPTWKTGAARRSRPLRRDFPRDAGASKAGAKLGPSTKDRLWGLAGGLRTSNLRRKFTGLREIFLFHLLNEERILLGPGRPRTGAASGTYSTRLSSTTSVVLTHGLDPVSLRGVQPWYQRSLVSSSGMTQHHLIPTGTQISDDLAIRRGLQSIPWGINRTWRIAISESNRFIQTCQAGFWVETSLYKVRAPNKDLHTKQDTRRFLLFDGDTIKADSELLTMRWRPTDHKRCQLEHLKQEKLIRGSENS